MNNDSHKLWFPYSRRGAAGKLRLFCFPYAGGGAGLYRSWAEKLPAYIEVFAVQLPGRETRTREMPFTRMGALVQSLMPVIHELSDEPFAFFGHSMGAIIAWELASQMKRQYGSEPIHLFVSGRRAPQVPDTDPPLHELPEAEFVEEVIRFNGVPQEAANHPELMELKTPLLRADFELCETYTYQPELTLNCPITAFGGLEDLSETHERIANWRERTTKFCKVHMLPGDHFFLQTSQTRLLQLLSEELRGIALWATSY